MPRIRIGLMRLRWAIWAGFAAALGVCGVSGEGQKGDVAVSGLVARADDSLEASKRAFGQEYCRMPDGRQICGPMCGACPASQCCRGTDMTCGSGPQFCEVKCTSQFGGCSGPINETSRNRVYEWWEEFGPGGRRNGRVQSGFEPPLRRKDAVINDVASIPESIAALDSAEMESGKVKSAEVDEEIPPFLATARQLDLDLTPNALLTLGASCNATPTFPTGGCQSSCCLSGKCTYCDKCVPNPETSSAGCKWCMKLKKPVSPTGCLFRGDTCTLPVGSAPGNPASGCKSGCCKNGKCTWCEDCANGCKCRALGQPMNPGGRCVTRTRTTSKIKTKTRTSTTLRIRGSGPGTGAIVESCVRPGMVALTFDDGPYIYTETLLNRLAARGVKATFFVNGNNAGLIYDRANLIRRMKNEKHCVASHGWLHDNEAQIGYDRTVVNLKRVSDAIFEIAGVRPKLHRPPYGAYNEGTQRAARLVGQNIIMWNANTEDWMQEGVPKQVENLRNITRTGSPTRSAYVVLMHDIWRSTAEQLADQAITLFQNLGYQLVDMGTCRSGSISGCYQ